MKDCLQTVARWVLSAGVLLPVTGFAAGAYTPADRVCLALNMYYEARGEGLQGMLAVGHVTLNRVRAPKWPESVCEVVKQPYQFSWTNEGHTAPPEGEDLKAWRQAWALSLGLLEQDRFGARSREEQAALFYHADYIIPSWSQRLRQLGQVGRHRFYAYRQE